MREEPWEIVSVTSTSEITLKGEYEWSVGVENLKEQLIQSMGFSLSNPPTNLAKILNNTVVGA